MKHIFSTFTIFILLYGTVYGQKILSNKIVVQKDTLYFFYLSEQDSINSKINRQKIYRPVKIDKREFTFIPSIPKYNDSEICWILGEDFVLGMTALRLFGDFAVEFSMVTFNQLTEINKKTRQLPENLPRTLGKFSGFFIWIRVEPFKFHCDYALFPETGASIFYSLSFLDNDSTIQLLLDKTPHQDLYEAWEIPRQEHLEVWEIPFDKEINRKRYFEWEKKREIPLEEPLGFFLSFEHQGQTYLIKKNTSAIYKVGKKLEKVRDLPHAFDDGLMVFDKDQDKVFYLLKKDFHRPELTFKEIIDAYGIILMQ